MTLLVPKKSIELTRSSIFGTKTNAYIKELQQTTFLEWRDDKDPEEAVGRTIWPSFGANPPLTGASLRKRRDLLLPIPRRKRLLVALPPRSFRIAIRTHA
jgi:hypothetical protein